MRRIESSISTSREECNSGALIATFAGVVGVGILVVGCLRNAVTKATINKAAAGGAGHTRRKRSMRREIYDPHSGAPVLAPHAGDLIAEISVAMQTGLPSRALMETIHVPSPLSEGLLDAAQALHGQAIHRPPDARNP
jgi:dihydrolipoamide dehydrogenase